MTWISANGGPPPFVSPDRNVSADEIATRDGEFGFGDFIDMINPLHHLPVIGPLYRHLTGDTIEGPARIIGGLIFGGPLGMAGAIGNAILEEATGRDISDTVAAAVFGDEAVPPTAAVAERRPPRAAPTAPPQAAETTPPPPAPASSGSPPAEPLSGLDALRAFARDSGLTGSGAEAGGDRPMPAPTTAASTSGQASTRQAPVDEQAAEAALRAAASGTRPAEPASLPGDRGLPRQVAAAGSPPPVDRFMPLGPRAFAGPMPVSGSRGALAAPSDDLFGSPAAALGSAGDYRPIPGAATSPQHPVAEQMMEALLKYQALRESRGES